MDLRELIKMHEVLETVKKDAAFVTTAKNNVKARVDSIKAEGRSPSWEADNIKATRQAQTPGMSARLANMKTLADPILATEKHFKNRDWVMSQIPLTESNGGLYALNPQAEALARSAVIAEGNLMADHQLILAAEAEGLPGGNVAKAYLYQLINNGRPSAPGRKLINLSNVKLPIQETAVSKINEIKYLVGGAELDLREASGSNPYEMTIQRMTLAREVGMKAE